MRTLRTLAKLVGHHGRLVPVCGAVIMFVSALTLAVPLYTKLVLEYIVPERASRLLDLSFLFFAAFLVVRFTFTAIQDLAVVVLRQKLERSTCERYLEAVFRLELAAFEEEEAGDLIGRFNVFINDIEWFLCDFVFFVFYAAFVFVCISVIMALVDPILYAVVVAFIPLHVLNFARFARPIRASSDAEQRERGRLTSFALEMVEGFCDIRTNRIADHFRARGDRVVARMNEAFFVRKRLGFQQQHLQSALVVVNHVAVIGLGSREVAAGGMRLGTLFFFFLLLESFYSPIYRFSAVSSALQAACTKIDRMAELIEHRSVERRERGGRTTEAPSSLALRGLAVDGLFREVDYRFERGHVYFVTGPSGCGKTTLLALLARMRRPTAGSIWVDGEDTTEWSPARLRRSVQGAPQDAVVFRRSVANNIHLGDPSSLDDARMRRAAYHAVADAFIARLPQRYDQELGEDGGDLSGGERQRIHLARLFYHDAPVMLFDEPTAALDLATEELFFTRLREIVADKIVIVVNHREQALRYADVVLTLTPTGLIEQRPPAAAAAV